MPAMLAKWNDNNVTIQDSQTGEWKRWNR
jgi:hypothetical protein